MKETLQLFKFKIRRDRKSIIAWTLGLVVAMIAIAFAFEGMYPTEMDRYAAMNMMQNPAMVAMLGPNFGVATLPALFTQEILLFALLALGIKNILFVVKHTRNDEELGRLELIRAFPVTADATLKSTLTLSFLTTLTIGALIALGLGLSGVEGFYWEGAISFGLVFVAAGWLFTSIAALTSQIFSTSRGAKSYAFLAFIIMYLMRAVGDVTNGWLSYLSPLGLVLRVAPFIYNRTAPLIIVMAISLLISGLAVYFNQKRDLGAGLVPAKAGRKNAKKSLLSPFGLAFRLTKNGIIGWSIGALIMGAVFGAVLVEAEYYMAGNEMIQMFLGEAEIYSLLESFIPFFLFFVVIILLIPVISPILKLVSEERQNLTEHLYGRAVSRLQVLSAYTVISIGASIILMGLTGIGFYAGLAAGMDEPFAFGTILNATLVYLPAIWVFVAFAIFLLGIFPKLSFLATLMIGFSFFVMFFGEMLEIPAFILNVSPLQHVPGLPSDEMNWTVMFVLTAIALGLAAVGMWGYEKRDING